VRADLADKPVASVSHVPARRAHQPPHICPTFPHPHIPPPSSPQSRNLSPNTAERAINLHFHHITRVPLGRRCHGSELSQVSRSGCASGQLPSLHSPICYRNMDEAYVFSPIGPDSSYPPSHPQSMAGCPIALQLTAGGPALPGESSLYVNHGRQ
jgi:hypothetical protein